MPVRMVWVFSAAWQRGDGCCKARLGPGGGIARHSVDDGEMCVCQRARELVLGLSGGIAQLDGDGDMIMPVGQHVPGMHST
jgi:hypothetical protein